MTNPADKPPLPDPARQRAGERELVALAQSLGLSASRADGREWIAVLDAEKLLKMLRGRENPILADKQTESKDVTSAGAVERHSEGHNGEARWKRARRSPSITGDDSGEQR